MMTRFLIVFLICTSLTSWAQQAQSTSQAINFIKLANTLRALNRPQQAIDLLERALPTVRANKQLYAQTVTYEVLGLAYNEADNTTQAINHLNRALAGYKRLKYYASIWAVNELIRDISNKNTYAGIQITASAVKVAIFRTRYEDGFYQKDITTRFDVPNMIEKPNRPGRDALQIGIDSARRYGVPNERIFVVLGSEVKRTVARTKGEGDRLYKQFASVLPAGVQPIDTTLTPMIEAELFTMGAVPKVVWPNTSALELSNGGTMGGYFDKTDAFHAITVPVGPYTLVNQIEPKRPLAMDAFKREAQRVVTAIADTALLPEFNRNGQGQRQRRTVGVGGDITWMLVACLHPEKVGTTAVPITTEDVARFKNLALTNYQGLTHPDLNSIPNIQLRKQAEDELTTVRELLTEKQVIAGALWLDAIMKVYAGQSLPKRFVFIRNADIGWATGRFLQTLNLELEKTIAKGARYTK